MYREDDVIELQLDSENDGSITGHCRTAATSKSVLRRCPPDAEEGIVVVDMPKRADYGNLWVTVYDDGLLIRVVDKQPVPYVRMGDFVFGVSADDDLASILLTSMSPEEISHARAELSGEGYDDVWTPGND